MGENMQRFHESVTGYAKVDREGGVIRDVRVIKTTSKNKRRYLEQALRSGIPLYEGVTIGIDHVKPTAGNPNPERAFSTFWGKLQNVRWHEDGLIGDLHYLKSHPMTEHILEAAERFPENFGLSHDADGDSTIASDGWREIHEITKVYSVDLVTNPGSTTGLFESLGKKGKTRRDKRREKRSNANKQPLVVSGSFQEGFILGGQAMSTVIDKSDTKRLFEEYMAEEMMGADSMASSMDVEMGKEDVGLEEAFKAEAMKVLEDTAMDSAAKLAKLKAIFKAKDQVMATLGGDMAKPKSDSKTESVEAAIDDEDKEEEDDEMMKESMQKQLGDLQEENRQLRASLELEQGKIVCKKLLEAAGCEATDVRINALLRTPEKERKALLESFSSKQARQKPASSPSALLESAGRGVMEYPKDIQDFKSVLR
jgi:hypothetical protein